MNNQFTAKWNFPTSIYFGLGAIQQLPSLCQQFNFKKPLIVTDPGLRDSDMVSMIIEILTEKQINAEIHSDIQANPIQSDVVKAVAAYRQAKCDGVIALGGGSSLDLGKTLALMCQTEISLWDFEDDGRPTPEIPDSDIAKIIAIPTTAGTGSEVGRCTVIVNQHTHQKKILFHPLMLPSAVICDPELTVSLPAHLTAATGMDALSHNLEAYCSPMFHPMADGIAIQGMKLIKENLIIAVNEPENLTARANMLAAATMGATAFQKGLGAMHALSHPLGALYNKHHGLLNAIVMPYVLEFNKQAIEDKFSYLAHCLNLSRIDVIDWIYQLREAINIPNTLNEIGIDDARVDEVITAAIKDPSAVTNPVKLDDKALRRIFFNAL